MSDQQKKEAALASKRKYYREYMRAWRAKDKQRKQQYAEAYWHSKAMELRALDTAYIGPQSALDNKAARG